MKRRLRFIIIAFSISFAIMAILSLFSLKEFDTLISYSNQVDHSQKVISQLYKLEGEIKDIDKTERGYMLTHDTIYLNSMYRHMDSLYPIADRIKLLVKDNASQKESIILVKTFLAERISYIRNNVSYLDSAHSMVPSSFYYDGREAMKKCMQRLRGMQAEEDKLLAERADSKKLYEQITADTLKYLLIIFSVITIAIFILMVRELKKRISYQRQLQVKVVDLQRSHTELEQIAYAASHDLQEPLRKIQVFSNRLVYLKKDELDNESKVTMEKVNDAAGRMQELIEDLVNLTSLTKEDTKKETVDLNMVLRNVMSDLDTKIEEKNAVINSKDLPKIKGSLEQLNILFKSLLDNAIKFSKDGLPPEILVFSDLVPGDELTDINKNLAKRRFYRITVSDNGIGFDNKFAYKLFRIFQRLHNQQSQYEGKGIGLAICQRIMTNHEGHILAHGHSEVGATFKLFFPVEE